MPRSRSQTASRPAGGMSQLTAAVKVLTEAGTPLSTRAMIEAMAANNYWTSPGGQTPHATLYAAILREIAQRGTAARFEKVDRGLFQLRATACQPAATKAKPSRKATRR